MGYEISQILPNYSIFNHIVVSTLLLSTFVSVVFLRGQGGHGPQKFSWSLHWPPTFKECVLPTFNYLLRKGSFQPPLIINQRTCNYYQGITGSNGLWIPSASTFFAEVLSKFTKLSKQLQDPNFNLAKACQLIFTLKSKLEYRRNAVVINCNEEVKNICKKCSISIERKQRLPTPPPVFFWVRIASDLYSLSKSI